MIINLILNAPKRNFFEEIKYEFRDLVQSFIDFFMMIKEHTYDVWCNTFGADIVNLFCMAIVVLIIILVALAIINR